VLYHGSHVPARLRQTVLHAMRELPPQIKLRVIGYETVGSPTFLRDFTATASEFGVVEPPGHRRRLTFVRKYSNTLTTVTSGSL
jgi:hypothetical protein